jgi:hypothetical protein
MSEFKDFQETINNQCSNILQEAYAIQKYAYSFNHIGNTILGNSLTTIADQLTMQQKIIQECVSKELDRQFEQSQQSSKNVLDAAFAGIHISSKTSGIS